MHGENTCYIDLKVILLLLLPYFHILLNQPSCFLLDGCPGGHMNNNIETLKMKVYSILIDKQLFFHRLSMYSWKLSVMDKF